MEERREMGEQPILVEDLNHEQREDLQQDGMTDSSGYHLGKGMSREEQISSPDSPFQQPA